MPVCNCVDPQPETCALCSAPHDTAITYAGDHFDYAFRVTEDDMWIASVMSYSAGDQVLTDRALARIKANVMRRLNAPRPCPSCGDPTAADLCAACSEWEGTPLDVDFVSVGWA